MTCLVDGNPPPSYTWFKNGNMNYVSSNVYIFCLYKLTFMFCHLVWLAAPCLNFFTYVTKTRANLSTYSRKPGNYNGTIIFEIDIMKKSFPLNLKFTFFATVKTKKTLSSISRSLCAQQSYSWKQNNRNICKRIKFDKVLID